MIHFKNKSGFTLAEVMVALAIFAIVATPLFILQGTTFRQIVRTSHRLHRIWQAKEFFFEAQKKVDPSTTKFILERKEDNPDTQLTYEIGNLRKDTPLGEIHDMYAESVLIRWQDGKQEEKMRMMLFAFKPQKKEKDEKESSETAQVKK